MRLCFLSGKQLFSSWSTAKFCTIEHRSYNYPCPRYVQVSYTVFIVGQWQAA